MSHSRVYEWSKRFEGGPEDFNYHARSRCPSMTITEEYLKKKFAYGS